MDFQSGDTLQLTSQSQIIWDQDHISPVPGAQRLMSFQIEEIVHIKQAVPLTWQFLGYSPILDTIER